MNWIVRQLFKWEALRLALFDEVNMYNYITRTMSDPNDIDVATSMWCEKDGWRGWTIEDNKYYFNDIPEKSISDLFKILHGEKSYV